MLTIFFFARGEAEGQVGSGACIALNCNKFEITVEPIATPACGQSECNRYYFQVSLLSNGLTIPGAPSSFNLCYDELSMSLRVTSSGGLSSINPTETGACLPAAYQGALGFDPGNQVTFALFCTMYENGNCSTPAVTFINTGGQYRVELFVIAVDAVPGEVLEFEPVLSAYEYPLAFISCQDLSFSADVFTVPSPSADEQDLCLYLADFDYGTELLPVMLKNAGIAAANVEYLSFSFTIETDGVMNPPKMVNFAQTPVEQSITAIAGTDDWRGYVRFDASPGIAVPGEDVLKLFDIEIKGPVNESLEAGAEVCFSQGQIRNGNDCKNACFDPGCANVVFDGDEPCPSGQFSVIVSAAPESNTCSELAVKAALWWSNLPSTLNFDQIRIALEFDLPAGVSISGVIDNEFGCPSSNPSCLPSSGFNDCFKIDGNRVTFCFFPATAQTVTLGSSFTVVFDAPINCINGVTVRESMVNVNTSPPGGDGCVAETFVTQGDFPLCSPLLSGWVRNPVGADIDDVTVQIQRTMPDPNCPPLDIWPDNAPWSWCACDVATYKITPEVRFTDYEDWLNGVSTFDLLLIARHLKGSIPFTTIYQYAAANGDGITNSIDANDIEEIRKLILGIYLTLPNNNSWRYYDAYDPGEIISSSNFTPPTEEWVGNPSDPTVDFVAVKVGDVNNTHDTDLAKTQAAGTLTLRSEALKGTAEGEYVSLPLRYEGQVPLAAVQFGLRFDAEQWEFAGVSAGEVAQVTEGCFNLSNATRGEIKFAWFGALPEEQAREGQSIFYLTLRAKRSAKSAGNMLQLDLDLMPTMAYNARGDRYDLRLGEPVETRQLAPVTGQSLSVTCSPNPTSGEFALRVAAAEATGKATVLVYSAFGDRLLRREILLRGGAADFQIPESANWPAGIYFWRVRAGDAKAEGRLVKN